MSLLLTGFAAALQTAVNQFLQLDQNARSQLRDLAGKVLAIQFTDLPLTLYFIPTRDDLQIFSRYDGAVDARLRGSSIQMLSMSASAKPADSFFKGMVDIEGDVELGQRFQDILGSLDIDAEERLSYLIGDVAAHKMGNALRGLLTWGGQIVQSLQDNTAEYLTFESNTLPARFELEYFYHDVDVLRDDVERLAARIQRLTPLLAADTAKAAKP